MVFSVKKSTLICVSVVLLLCVACGFIVNTQTFATVFSNRSTRKIPVYGVDCGEEKLVALTFDAAWGADKTLKILEILEKYDVKATFFLVGFWLDKYPEETKAIAESGCEIGNHSNNHLQMSKLSADKISEELSYVNDAVYKLTGKKPTYFRPPFGDYDNELIETAENMGLQTIQWSVDSLDWKGLSATEITSRVTKNVKNGSIVLFHNNSDNILEALPLVLANLINSGYKPVTMSELVYADDYYIDNNGVQHKNA